MMKSSFDEAGLNQYHGFLEDELANQVSSEIHFKPDLPAMYYYSREPSRDSAFTEGFAE